MSKATVTFDMGAINKLTSATVRALEQTAEALHTEVVQAQVVPRDKGTLQGEAFFVDYSKSGNGTVSLVHSTPYARRLYYHPEYNFNREHNPNAQAHWLDDWADGGKHSDFAKSAFSKFYKQQTGV
jgi:hypothetical protein